MNTTKPFARSACAVANSLDILGDKWSLLVVRDLLHGKRTYGELALSPERIPTNILADRLKRLESAGIVTSTPYQERPVRYAYTLTPKGRALKRKLVPLALDVNKVAIGGAGAADVAATRKLLLRMIENLAADEVATMRASKPTNKNHRTQTTSTNEGSTRRTT